MSTSLATRVRLKIKRIARELTESAAEREFRHTWEMVDPIEGWLLPSQGKWLFNAARTLPAGANVVEIGSFKGRSTCCLALGCQGSEKHVYAIDPFDGGPDLPKADSLPDFSQNLRRCGVSGCVEPIVGLSNQVARNWSKPIHLLFIDG